MHRLDLAGFMVQRGMHTSVGERQVRSGVWLGPGSEQKQEVGKRGPSSASLSLTLMHTGSAFRSPCSVPCGECEVQH